MSGILSLLESLGYTFSSSGNYRRCDQFDSLVVNVNKDLFFWNSKGIGGNAYQFLTLIERKSKEDALNILNDGNIVINSLEERPKRTISFPDRSKINYLVKRAEYYHKSLMDDEQKIQYWLDQGINSYSITKFNLGWAYECPVVRYIDSYTIPYIRGSDIINIKHRLNINGSDKYRPEMSGINNYLFNVNGLYRDDGVNWPGDAILLEGEKKAIVFNQHGFRAVSMAGANAWHDDFLNDFYKAKVNMIYVMLDPGMEELSEKLANNIRKNGINSRAVFLPEKPDDFINMGYRPNDVLNFMYS